MPDPASRIQAAIGVRPESLHPLSGGCIGEVFAALLTDGRRVVAKVASSDSGTLDIEGFMLQELAAAGLPVPRVLHSERDLLIMELIPGESRFSAAAQRHAAELLATLHDRTSSAFGLARDTLIGGLHQPNTPNPSWIDFFGEQRLLYMAREALTAGRLRQSTLARIQRLAAALSQFLLEPDRPSLIHGDVWTTNVLAQGDRITAFLDPAIYYADPEIELAFITLFDTFGQPFFQAYHERRPIREGFFETRRDIYNLYPLLVHVRLFGGSYESQVLATLTRLGF
jgi:fructosamine-3-kinase